jgi:hypothetical protein
MLLEEVKEQVFKLPPSDRLALISTRPTAPRAQYPCPNSPENIEIMRQAIGEKLGR